MRLPCAGSAAGLPEGAGAAPATRGRAAVAAATCAVRAASAGAVVWRLAAGVRAAPGADCALP